MEMSRWKGGQGLGHHVKPETPLPTWSSLCFLCLGWSFFQSILREYLLSALRLNLNPAGPGEHEPRGRRRPTLHSPCGCSVPSCNVLRRQEAGELSFLGSRSSLGVTAVLMLSYPCTRILLPPHRSQISLSSLGPPCVFLSSENSDGIWEDLLGPGASTYPAESRWTGL